MWAATLLLAFSVTLAPPFGDAEATALTVNADGSAVLEVTVEVSGAPAAVLVRGVGIVDELPPVALAPRGDGTYGGLVQLNTTAGVLLGFEYLPAGGGAGVVTELFTLVDLGVDPAVLAGVIGVAPESGATSTVAAPSDEAAEAPVSGGDRSWAWLAIASGAAFLVLLALWIRMGRIVKVDNLSGIPDNSVNADDLTTEPERQGAG